MSVIIVSHVISGEVGTSLRRIGILKAIGFTPREVVRAYVAQALILCRCWPTPSRCTAASRSRWPGGWTSPCRPPPWSSCGRRR
ncbi:hypothetical protein [Streptomyces sp. NP-1717]|uniref:hypothetical protein n=1 Tax=Streptomyces sp. NP-1717 TaxID=2704470 RepID=UPI0035B319BA